MRVAVLLLLLAGCAPERDYTLSRCPDQVVRMGELDEACDRGVGAWPRFVTLDACAIEVGRADLAERPRSYPCHHPNQSVCNGVATSFPRILCTIDDVEAAPR